MRFEVDWKKAGLAAGKLVLNLAGASMATGAVDIVGSISRKAPAKLTPKEKAADWIGRALAAAILDVFEEARSRHEAEQAKPPGARNHAYLLKAPLPDRLDDIVLDVDNLPRGFLERPDRLDVWAEVGDAVLRALEKAGCGAPVVEGTDWPEYLPLWIRLEIAGDLPDRFVEMLDVFWRELGFDDDFKHFFRTPVAAAADAASKWRAYRRTLIGWPHDPENNRLFSEAFPIADLYVPLRGYEVLDPDGAGYDHDVPDPGRGRRKPARHFDLTERTIEWFRTAKKQNSLALISGGPGSGKSTFARMFAARVAVRPNWRVLFVPLHEVKDARTWDQALTTLAEIAGLPGGLAADLADGPRRTLAVLDGIDEMQTLGHGVSVSLALFDHLATRLAADRLRVLALGRDIGVDAVRPQLRRIAPTCLHVAPLVCDGDLRRRFDWENERPEFDLRRDWWERYRRVRPDSDAPDLVSDDVLNRLPDLTASPVLNALLGLMIDGWDAERAGLLDLAEMDRARLYDRVIRGVHARTWSAPGGTSLNTLHDPERFLWFLEAVALAAFRDSTRTASFDAVRAALDDPEVAAELERVLRYEAGTPEHSRDLPDLAMMAFHFRFAAVAGEARFEFTHKSFADYLLARRIVRAAEEKPDPREWVETFGDVFVTWDVFLLLREEARRRAGSAFEPLVEPADRLSAHLAGLLRVATGDGFPLPACTEGWTEAGLRTRGAHAECTLLAVTDALCRAQDDCGQDAGAGTIGHVRVDWPDEWAARRMIHRQYERLESVVGLENDDLIVKHCLSRIEFLPFEFLKKTNRRYRHAITIVGIRLDRIYLERADLSHSFLAKANLSSSCLALADLRGANMESAILTDADLQAADLTGVNLRSAWLSGARFHNALLQDSDLRQANLRMAVLWEAQLQGTNLRGANLRLAILTGADLQCAQVNEADLRAVKGLDAGQLAGAVGVDQSIMTPRQRAELGLEPQPQDREIG